jgi:hypothetical protein
MKFPLVTRMTVLSFDWVRAGADAVAVVAVAALAVE